eukprot:7649420-Ditylum_brightwellii.AAC.1
MVTFSKPLTEVEPQGNGPQEFKPIILIERPQVCELMKGNYHMYKLCTVPYNDNLHTYDLTVPFYINGTAEKWLEICQNLQAVINRQNITDPKGIYMITKSVLRGDALTAFENVEEVNRPKSKLAYKKTMENVYTNIPTFIARVNAINIRLEQLPPRDDGTPQVKLA